MKFDFNRIFLGLKRISPALVAVFFSTLLYIVFPHNWLQYIGLGNLPAYVKQIIGGLFIVSLSLLISLFIFMLIKKVKKNAINRSINKQIKELTIDELLRVLLTYYSPAHSLSMSLQDGVTGAIKKKGIILFASEVNDDAVLEIYGRAVLDNEIEEFNNLKGLCHYNLLIF